MKILVRQGEAVETDNMSLEELRLLDIELCAEADDISAQLKMAHLKRVEDGEVIDRSWLISAERALNYRRKSKKQLAVLIQQKTANEKQVASLARCRLFVDVCKERMAVELFDSLMSEAENRRLTGLRKLEMA